MHVLRRIALILVAAFALGILSAPAFAQNEADALNKQVVALVQAKKYAEATPLAQRVLAIRERSLGRDHPETIAARKTLIDIYRAQNRTAEADALQKLNPRQFELAAAPPPPRPA